MELHNKIAKISLEHFNILPKSGKPSATEWTILSCIVKENVDSNSFEVVALGTGSKCIGASKMSANGDILNDSHSEVICRRAFLTYLYYEIELCLSGESHIFICNSDTQKCILKNSIFFHFFNTHVPCGDAAIFPRNQFDDVGSCLLENMNDSKSDSEPLKKRGISCIHREENIKSTVHNNDIFRTGAKSLPNDEIGDPYLDAAHYHTIGLIRTKPGRGDPTLSVSCSDKLAKWCYLGIQGSLISILLDKPIYLKSLTLAGGTPYCIDALERALDRRFDDIDLGCPYRKRKMIYGQADLTFEFHKCEFKRPCSSSIIWNKDKISVPEVAVNGKKQGTTKKNVKSIVSRVKICKIQLFKRITYKEGKCLAKDYQNAWITLKQKVFRIWTVKNPKLLEFLCDK